MTRSYVLDSLDVCMSVAKNVRPLHDFDSRLSKNSNLETRHQDYFPCSSDSPIFMSFIIQHNLQADLATLADPDIM
jgi:hypothetical protein